MQQRLLSKEVGLEQPVDLLVTSYYNCLTLQGRAVTQKVTAVQQELTAVTQGVATNRLGTLQLRDCQIVSLRVGAHAGRVKDTWTNLTAP
jgi:hypothetical protein